MDLCPCTGLSGIAPRSRGDRWPQVGAESSVEQAPTGPVRRAGQSSGSPSRLLSAFFSLPKAF